MPDVIMQTSALDGVLSPGRFGRALPEGPGTFLSHTHPCELASVIAANGKDRSVATALKSGFGLALPGMGKSASARGLSIHGVAPSQWMVVSPARGRASLVSQLDAKLGKVAMVCDQSHGRTVMHISGPRARDVLSKGTPVDMGERVFIPGMVAATQIGHVGVSVACTGADSFDLITLRSFAMSLWTGLSELALEWGYEVR